LATVMAESADASQIADQLNRLAVEVERLFGRTCPAQTASD
jgi:hypothetical protein